MVVTKVEGGTNVSLTAEPGKLKGSHLDPDDFSVHTLLPGLPFSAKVRMKVMTERSVNRFDPLGCECLERRHEGQDG